MSGSRFSWALAPAALGLFVGLALLGVFATDPREPRPPGAVGEAGAMLSGADDQGAEAGELAGDAELPTASIARPDASPDASLAEGLAAEPSGCAREATAQDAAIMLRAGPQTLVITAADVASAIALSEPDPGGGGALWRVALALCPAAAQDLARFTAARASDPFDAFYGGARLDDARIDQAGALSFVSGADRDGAERLAARFQEPGF